MIAKLEFNLPDDDDFFNNALNGTNMRHALSDIMNFIRSKEKEGNSKVSLDELKKVFFDAIESVVGDI